MLFGCYGLTDHAVGNLENCKELRKLLLGGCKNVSDSSLVDVANSCSKLEHLELSYTKITDTTIIELGKQHLPLKVLHQEKQFVFC